MSLISLPAFLLTRPPTSHSKESFLYWGMPGRALRQVKLVVRNVAAGLLCLPTGAGQAAWVHIRGEEREGGDPGRTRRTDHDHIGMWKDTCAYAQKRGRDHGAIDRHSDGRCRKVAVDSISCPCQASAP